MIGLYMDVHIPRPITAGLRRRGVGVATAQAVGFGRAADPLMLDRATDLKRILFTRDRDFLQIIEQRFFAGVPHSGVVFAYATMLTYRQCIDDLELVSMASSVEEWLNNLVILPL